MRKTEADDNNTRIPSSLTGPEQKEAETRELKEMREREREKTKVNPTTLHPSPLNLFDQPVCRFLWTR